MCGIKMTEYTFEVRQTVKVTVQGNDTDENYKKAENEAIRQIKHDIDDDWLELRDVVTDTDYENEFKEAV